MSRTLKDNHTSRRENAALLVSPAFQACTTVASCASLEEIPTGPGEVLDELQAIASAVAAGDMKHPEALAITQATALNVLFARLSAVAMSDIQSPNFDSLMRLALRSQSQCFRTLNTLASLKAPAVFQQLNVAGQQIVNNNSNTNTSSHPSQPPPAPQT